jgi:hypothetical protein
MKTIKVKNASYSKDGVMKAIDSETGENIVIEKFYFAYYTMADAENSNNLHMHGLNKDELIIVEGGVDQNKNISIAIANERIAMNGKKV